MEGSEELPVRGKRTSNPAGLDVGQAFGELCVNDLALPWRVFIIRRGQFGNDRDHPAGHPKLQFFAALETCPPTHGLRYYKGSLIIVFHGERHDERPGPDVLSVI